MVTCNAPSLTLSPPLPTLFLAVPCNEPYLLKAEATVAMAYFIDAPLPCSAARCSPLCGSP